jgi:hypothetical protein
LIEGKNLSVLGVARRNEKDLLPKAKCIACHVTKMRCGYYEENNRHIYL